MGDINLNDAEIKQILDIALLAKAHGFSTITMVWHEHMLVGVEHKVQVDKQKLKSLYPIDKKTVQR